MGRGLEFPRVLQPVATGRTADYHIGADTFACYYHDRRHRQKVLNISELLTIITYFLPLWHTS